jgi:hypothetical protein
MVYSGSDIGKIVHTKITVWFILYGFNMSPPPPPNRNSPPLVEVCGDGVMRVQCTYIGKLCGVLQWSNGHPWRWPYRSVQHISDRCERCTSGRNWFWETDESQFEIYPLHGNCTLEMFTARLWIQEADLYREDVFNSCKDGTNASMLSDIVLKNYDILWE